MLLQLEKVIDTAQLDVIGQALKQALFVDGKLSAGVRARRVKNNREIDKHSQEAAYLQKIIMGNLQAHSAFRSAALPHRVATPLLARYEPGMTYGEHIDDPIMGESVRFRCDVACTVFLNGPDLYDGGELVIRTSFGEHAVKLAAGDAVLYPASSLHHVAPVTRGERLVAVTWVHSMIREAHKRELLYELSLAREQLMASSPEALETTQVDHTYVNLVRMWADV